MTPADGPGPRRGRQEHIPTAQADFPVGGVSWYEAAAYAAFAGKSLPTMYHWYRAADLGRFADILTVSNFNAKGPGPVGSYGRPGTVRHVRHGGQRQGMVLERQRAWAHSCWAARGTSTRTYLTNHEARSPFDRAPGDGFRLAKYIGPLPAAGHRASPGPDASVATLER